jgi:hypothetical protein
MCLYLINFVYKTNKAFKGYMNYKKIMDFVMDWGSLKYNDPVKCVNILKILKEQGRQIRDGLGISKIDEVIMYLEKI